MAMFVLFVGALIALACLAGTMYVPQKAAKGGLAIMALVVLIGSVVFSSIRFVPADKVGIVTRNAFGPSLKDGRIIATGGEMGVQADVLAPGWHTGYWPILFDVNTVPLTEIKSGEVGLVEAR